MLQDRVAEFLKAHPDISSKGDMYFRSRSPHPVRLPMAFSNDLCRLIGWIHGLTVPAYIRGLGLQFRAKYVGGLYDAESHVKKRQAEIDFSSTCGAIQREVGMTLGELDIGRTLSDRQRTSREFEVYIYGKGDLRRFDTYVGYAHPVKKQALMRALTPPLNTRVVPAVNDAS
jgi:LAGLIDADG-like domain